MNTLKPGDRVYFDVNGVERSPYGSGVVTRLLPGGGVMVMPDNTIPLRFQMTNVRKVE